MQNKVDQILRRIKSHSKPGNREGMARFGINIENAYGVSVNDLRKIAKELGTNHELAVALWITGKHEARILSAFIADPDQVTEELMENWVGDFNSWDLCDQVCSNLFDRRPFAYKKATEWTNREEEFIKRAGFVLMAALAVHDKSAPNSRFEKFFTAIKTHANDNRNYVKKAVNWALRQIGKRNLYLNKKAIAVAEGLGKNDSGSAQWIAKDALRELRSEKVQKKLN